MAAPVAGVRALFFPADQVSGMQRRSIRTTEQKNSLTPYESSSDEPATPSTFTFTVGAAGLDIPNPHLSGQMHRIDTKDSQQKWQWACPTAKQHRDWRVVDGQFECRSCGETFDALLHLPSGEQIKREEIEVVGAHADHKGRFGRPTVE